MSKNKIFIIYHYLYPDEVVSSLHMTQLSIGLANNGYNVHTLSSNRSCRDPGQSFNRHEKKWNVNFNRIWRPDFKQSSFFGRIANSIFIQTNWLIFFIIDKIKTKDYPNFIILGTDPIFLFLLILPLKLIFPKTKFILWSFDLYPEAFIAKKNIKNLIYLKPILQITNFAYSKFNYIVDIGYCMRKRIMKYNNKNNFHTIVPWSVFEIENTKKSLIPKEISILYSGNLGEAHDIKNLLNFIELLGHKKDLKFFFNVSNEQRILLSKHINFKNIKNINFLNKTNDYITRLQKFDIHLVTLKKNWEGIVVPSKFFSSLSLAKPILYIGPTSSSIYKYIKNYDLGWAINIENINNDLFHFSDEYNNLKLINRKSRNCIDKYKSSFSKDIGLEKWMQILNKKY